ncbi:MAG: hypothetical protein ABUS57_01660 [Pseudomonadota bacterium]
MSADVVITPNKQLSRWVLAALTAGMACTTQAFAQPRAQTGSRLVVELNVAALRSQELDNLQTELERALDQASPAVGYEELKQSDRAVHLRLRNASDRTRAQQAIASALMNAVDPSDNPAATISPDGLIDARPSPDATARWNEHALQSALVTIHMRIDPTGSEETYIVHDGDLRIRIDAPRIANPETLVHQIGGQAVLTFNLVDDTVTPADIASGNIPASDVLAQPNVDTTHGTAVVVHRTPSITGDELQTAHPMYDQRSEEWVLSFTFDREGKSLLCHLTTDNVDKRFAVLLDGAIIVAPRILEPICGGTGQIEGDFTAESASNLALLLNSGALPAPLLIVEEGPIPTSKSH